MQWNSIARPRKNAGSRLANPWYLSLLTGIAVAISLLSSACGSSTSLTSSEPVGAPDLGTPGEYTCLQGSITASGSPALASLVQAVAKDYAGRCSGAHITVTQAGSITALRQLESRTVQIGDSDIFRLANQNDLFDHEIAVMVFALAVNRQVTGISTLTTPQLRGIYAGTITNWHQVGGPTLPIVVISRPPSSDTRAIFQQEVLGRPETITGPSNLTSDTTSTVVQNIQQTPGAIGYIPISAAQQAEVTIVTINGHAPTAALVKNNAYPFWTIEHMYTRGPGSGLAEALIDFTQSAQGQQAIRERNFIAVNEMPESVLQARQPNLAD